MAFSSAEGITLRIYRLWLFGKKKDVQLSFSSIYRPEILLQKILSLKLRNFS